jgi:hypothetical protein
VVAAPATAAAVTAPEPGERRGFRLPSLPFRGDRSEPETGGTGAAVLASDSAEAAAMGAEQVAARGDGSGADSSRPAEPRMTAAVVASEIVPYKRLQVELDNGQVWRQVQSDESWDDARYGVPASVEIWPSRFGGYRMLIAEHDLRLRVERVR